MLQALPLVEDRTSATTYMRSDHEWDELTARVSETERTLQVVLDVVQRQVDDESKPGDLLGNLLARVEYLEAGTRHQEAISDPGFHRVAGKQRSGVSGATSRPDVHVSEVWRRRLQDCEAAIESQNLSTRRIESCEQSCTHSFAYSVCDRESISAGPYPATGSYVICSGRYGCFTTARSRSWQA